MLNIEYLPVAIIKEVISKESLYIGSYDVFFVNFHLYLLKLIFLGEKEGNWNQEFFRIFTNFFFYKSSIILEIFFFRKVENEEIQI